MSQQALDNRPRYDTVSNFKKLVPVDVGQAGAAAITFPAGARDHAYDSEGHRWVLRWLGITSVLARRGAEKSSGLGGLALGGGTHAELAAPLSPPVDSLRTPCGHSSSVFGTGLHLICYKWLIGSSC